MCEDGVSNAEKRERYGCALLSMHVIDALHFMHKSTPQAMFTNWLA